MLRWSLIVPLVLTVLAVACVAPAADEKTSSTGGDRAQLNGTWKIVGFQDDGSDKIGRLGVGLAKKGQEPRIAKLVFSGDECFVVRADGKRDMLAGLTNCAWKTHTLDEKTSPKSIDIVGFAGKESEKTQTYFGIYELVGGKLRICWNEGGKARPTKLESNGEMNLFECERLSDQPEKPAESR